MKTILSLFVFLSILAGGIWLFIGTKGTSGAEVTKVLTEAAKQAKQVVPTEKPSPGIPKRLVVEKLDINATIESVGMDDKGRMDVPALDENVAWYNLGYKPGDNGSAVIAGHLDTRSGGPAVFYNIGKLVPGDTIEVVDDKEQRFRYEVIDTQTYDFDKVPLQQIFGTQGQATLNLITCEGTFNRENQNYSKRLVVFTKQIE